MLKRVKKIIAPLVLVAVLLIFVTACYYESDNNIPGLGYEDTVVTFLNHLIAEDYDAVTQMLSTEMQAALSAVPLQVIVSGRLGNMIDISMLDILEHEGLQIYTVAANHSKGSAVHQIVLDANGYISGFQNIQFNFQPMMPPENANYTAEAVVIGEGTIWPLDGLLTIPQNASVQNPVPALILIPGSGANNMDSSLFENRPFFDIAHYLSSNGVAVLRYNERAFSHGIQLTQTFGANVTLQEEYIEDALLAVQILRNDPRISQIFVLGHSLGGIVAPRIAEEGGLDGVVIMASSPRPLHLIIYDQNTSFIRDSVEAGIMSQADADMALALLAAQLEEAQNLLNMPPEELANIFIFGAIPAIYELSIIESLPLPFIIRNTDTPVLILQGSRDFQTTVEDDFQIFLEGTADMPHVTTILYDGLNHLMMTAYRQYGPLVLDVMEYAIQGNVDINVTRDILTFVLMNN